MTFQTIIRHCRLPILVAGLVGGAPGTHAATLFTTGQSAASDYLYSFDLATIGASVPTGTNTALHDPVAQVQKITAPVTGLAATDSTLYAIAAAPDIGTYLYSFDRATVGTPTPGGTRVTLFDPDDPGAEVGLPLTGLALSGSSLYTLGASAANRTYLYRYDLASLGTANQTGSIVTLFDPEDPGAEVGLPLTGLAIDGDTLYVLGQSAGSLNYLYRYDLASMGTANQTGTVTLLGDPTDGGAPIGNPLSGLAVLDGKLYSLGHSQVGTYLYSFDLANIASATPTGAVDLLGDPEDGGAPIGLPLSGLAVVGDGAPPISPVPEPTSWLLLMLGLGGAGALMRHSPSLRRERCAAA